MVKKKDFDVAVVGGGPGGYVAAIRASQLGASVCLIERSELGGVCTNVGCIPTKALIHTARMMVRLSDAAKQGINVAGVSLDFAKVAARRDRVVKSLRGGVEALLKGNGVELVRGEASFKGPNALSVATEKGSTGLTASKIVLATGAEPVVLPGMEFDGRVVLSSADAVRLNELPDSVLIVGGGYIGCEFAFLFSAFGVEVTLVEAMETVLPLLDKDCSREVLKHLKKNKVKALLATKVEKLRTGDGGAEATLSDGSSVEAEKVLVCVGRKARADEMNLKEAGLESRQDGSLEVNEQMQTAQPNIYAVGDVTGEWQLAHVASQEGLVAAAHATGSLSARMDYRVAPACVFTYPEVATVGLTEEQAKEQVQDAVVKKFPFRALGKAYADDETDGFVKMIADGRTGEVLGVHILAGEASSLIGEAVLGMALEATAAEFAEAVHPHPTFCESLREAAEGIVGLPINWAG